MIVPAPRLLLVTGVGAVPLLALGGVAPEARALVTVLLALLAIVVVLDVVLSLNRLGNVRPELPPLLRQTRDRAGEIALLLHHAQRGPMRLSVGLPLPAEIEAPLEILTVQLPPEPGLVVVPFACTPRRRGRFALTSCCLATLSPMRFWEWRRVLPLQTDLRVYPNLGRERRLLANFFLNRGTTGLHAVRQLGRGREFEKLRDYLPGDAYEEIHWKTTAKRGRPVTKVFQLERTQEVYVVLDTSRLSARPAPLADSPPGDTPSYLDRFLTAALIVGLAAEQQGDRFGLVTFGNRVDRFLRASNGKAHYGTCRDLLYTLQPQLVSPDYQELCTTLRLRLPRRALLLILTSVDDPLLAEQLEGALRMLHRQHVVLVNMIQPSLAQPLFSDDQVQATSDVYSHLAGHLLWHDLGETAKRLSRLGVPLHLLRNESLCAELLTHYLNVKKRQLL